MVNNLFLCSISQACEGDAFLRESTSTSTHERTPLLQDKQHWHTPQIKKPPKKQLVLTQLLSQIWNKIQNAILHKRKVYKTLSQRWSLTFSGLLKQSTAYMCNRFKYAKFFPTVVISDNLFYSPHHFIINDSSGYKLQWF